MQKRPHTQNETADMYVPHMAMARANYQSNNQEIPGPDYTHVPIAGQSKGMEGAEIGLMPDQRSPLVSRASSRTGNRDRAQSANANMGLGGHDDDDEDDNKSKKSQTSRGGYRPVKPPPNPNTQTGKLGYHGKAVGESELLMMDPIRRGKKGNWSAKQVRKVQEEQKAEMKASLSQRAFQDKRRNTTCPEGFPHLRKSSGVLTHGQASRLAREQHATRQAEQEIRGESHNCIL